MIHGELIRETIRNAAPDLVLNSMQDLVEIFLLKGTLITHPDSIDITKGRKSTTVVCDFQRQNDTEMREPIRKKIKRTAERIKSQRYHVHN